MASKLILFYKSKKKSIMAKNQKADAHNPNKETSGINKIRKANLDNQANQNNLNNKEFKGKK